MPVDAVLEESIYKYGKSSSKLEWEMMSVRFSTAIDCAHRYAPHFHPIVVFVQSLFLSMRRVTSWASNPTMTRTELLILMMIKIKQMCDAPAKPLMT